MLIGNDLDRLPKRKGMSLTRGNPVGDQLRAEQFAQMQQIYGNSGGLVDCECFMRLLAPTEGQPLSVLAKLIVSRRLVTFKWEGRSLIPMFQVECGSLAMRPYMPETLYELVDVFDDWEISCWFTQSSCWLAGEAPAIAMGRDPEAVFLAARADRFIAKG